MNIIACVLAIHIGLVIATATIAQEQSGSGMQLDQRNQHLHAATPMQDFAQISGSHGEGTLGTISMIDGNQTANFDGNGQFVSGTGRFEYRAKVSGGLYMDLTFNVDGKKAHGGVYVADMIVEFRSQGRSAAKRVVIRQLKLANSKFEYAISGKGGGISNTTTMVKNKSMVDGRLRLQLLHLKGRPKNQWFSVRLDGPLDGRLQ